MNFRQIEAFRAVMTAGTVTRAAELMQLSQPAVSRHLAELERSARLKLFERGRGRLTPTAEGQAFYKEVQRTYVGLDRLKFAAENIRSFAAGTLRIISLPALGHAFLPRVIGRYAKQYPDVSILLQIRNSEQVKSEVAAGNFDIGIAADEITRTGVETRLFAHPDAVCLLPQGHRLADRAALRPQDLEGERFVALASEDAARARIDKVFDTAGVQTRIVVETQYSLTICGLVRNGVGVALVNPISLEGLDLTGIKVATFSPSVQFRSLLVFPPANKLSLLAQAFLDFAEIERDASLGWHPGSQP